MAWAIHQHRLVTEAVALIKQLSSEGNSLPRKEHAAPFCLRDPPASDTTNSSLFLLAGL